MKSNDLYQFLESKYLEYNTPAFIEDDPVSIPHRFSTKENIEISAFLAAMLAWGRRSAIIAKSGRLIDLMNNDPLSFLQDSGQEKWKHISSFVYRTFNGSDCLFYLKALETVYLEYGGLENIFLNGYQNTGSIWGSIHHVRQILFKTEHELRSEKHFPNVEKGSAAKRMNMFLRWMVRDDNRGVDFGLWKSIPQSALIIPLDLHTGNVARKLGILDRKQNDRLAATMLTEFLQKLDVNDPVKYDFALFGLGVYGEI